MNVLWGGLILLVGVLFVAWGRTRSDFVVYRLFVARSRVLWGDRVHDFYQVAGITMIAFGLLVAILG
ncbi:MAG: hypothetical protein KC481_18835 [Acidimicrobiaceae bacterium]|nr:hypothetical protein [Acidimicrobiaceae bacterium]MBT6445269.1 hypothetical protein [Acidimicrobiaceae bacterium]MCO4835719.1 hypothetical protein [Acidimicrobiaceae bacterium]MDG1087455.1 hypothetical protein [Acidimicrobiales bacterium]